MKKIEWITILIVGIIVCGAISYVGTREKWKCFEIKHTEMIEGTAIVVDVTHNFLATFIHLLLYWILIFIICLLLLSDFKIKETKR